jgi:hypothetical protein
MYDFDIFVFVVVPLGCALVVWLALYVQKREERKVQKHVDRLIEIRAEIRALSKTPAAPAC